MTPAASTGSRAASSWCTREGDKPASAASLRIEIPASRADASAQSRSRSALRKRHAASDPREHAPLAAPRFDELADGHAGQPPTAFRKMDALALLVVRLLPTPRYPVADETAARSRRSTTTSTFTARTPSTSKANCADRDTVPSLPSPRPPTPAAPPQPVRPRPTLPRVTRTRALRRQTGYEAPQWRSADSERSGTSVSSPAVVWNRHRP